MADTYLTLINKAITDFNTIHSALASKSVNNGTVVTTSSALKTNEMSTLITSQLWRVGTRGNSGDSKGAPVNANGVIADFGGAAKELALAADDGVVSGDGALTIKTAGLEAGYYDTNSYFTISLNGVLESVGIGNAKLSEDGLTYKIVAGEGKIISDVSIAKGKVTNTNSVTIEGTASATPTVTPKYGSLKISTTATTGAKTFTLTPSVTVAGNVNSTLTPSITDGYITTNEVSLSNGSVSLEALSGTGAAETFYIEKGGISDLSTGSAAVQVSSSDGVTLVTEENKVVGKTYYEISGHVKSGDTLDSVTVTGNIKEGYVDAADGGTIGTASVTSGSVYVAATDVKLNTADTLGLTVKSDTGSITTSSSAGAYAVTLSGSKDVTASAEAGYIASDVSKTDTVSAEKTIYVAHGSASETVGASITPKNGSATLTTSDTGYSFKISYKPTVSVEKSVTPGYIKTGDVTVTLEEAKEQTFYVQKGSVTPGVTLDAILNDAGDNLEGEATDSEGHKINIFQNEKPTSGDYYSVVASAGANSTLGAFTPGYITAADIAANATKTLYIPKATFKYVTGTKADGSDDVLMVEKGGFVPSGTLTEIAQISGSLDSAVATLTYNNNGGLLLKDSAAGAYTVTLKADVTNAGYLSSNENKLSGSLYITQGSTSITAAAGALSQGSEVVSNDKGGYKISVSGDVTTTVAFSEGYHKAADMLVGGAAYDASTNKTIVTSVSKDVELAKAELSVNAAGLTLGVTPTVVEFVGDETKYRVTPTISGSAIATVTTAGYATTNENKTVTIADASLGKGNIPTLYIKEGAVKAISNGDTAATIENSAVSLNPSTSTYQKTVSGTLSAKATITSGYVDDGTATGTVRFDGHVVDMGKGAATVTPVLSGEIETTLATRKTGGEGYIAINAKAASTGGTGEVTTEGYLKENAQITLNAVASAVKDTAYVETLATKYATESITSGTDYHGSAVDATVYNGGTIGSLSGDIDGAASDAKSTDTAATTGLRDTMYVDTSAKYAVHDVRVKLSPNAMGSSVVDELQKLKNRLNGTYVS